jgi:hypothetical protein
MNRYEFIFVIIVLLTLAFFAIRSRKFDLWLKRKLSPPADSVDTVIERAEANKSEYTDLIGQRKQISKQLQADIDRVNKAV